MSISLHNIQNHLENNQQFQCVSSTPWLFALMNANMFVASVAYCEKITICDERDATLQNISVW